MANVWSGADPVSLPPRWLAYLAGLFILVMAIIGVGIGFQAAWRAPNEPGSTSGSNRSIVADGEIIAHPIVEMPPPAAAPSADKSNDAGADVPTDSAPTDDSIASKTAAAQALQSKSSKSSGNIDDILASPQEKPPAAVKAQADEAPPIAPVKSDVPF